MLFACFIDFKSCLCDHCHGTLKQDFIFQSRLNFKICSLTSYLGKSFVNLYFFQPSNAFDDRSILMCRTELADDDRDNAKLEFTQAECDDLLLTDLRKEATE